MDVRRGAGAGARAGAVALAAAEVLAAIVPGAPSLVASVGQEVIDRVPPVVEDAAISVFGTNDKLALVVGIVAVSLIIAAALGVAARRRFGVAVLGFLAFGAVGLAAAAGRPDGQPGPALL
ncbi:MAG: molybdopterin-binding oxidoreductase, partial [Actinomycetota bacterium]|nr:molybdopterin-binding oxidoreductase [Actinomycetota bacterium]